MENKPKKSIIMKKFLIRLTNLFLIIGLIFTTINCEEDDMGDSSNTINAAVAYMNTQLTVFSTFDIVYKAINDDSLKTYSQPFQIDGATITYFSSTNVMQINYGTSGEKRKGIIKVEFLGFDTFVPIMDFFAENFEIEIAFTGYEVKYDGDWYNVATGTNGMFSVKCTDPNTQEYEFIVRDFSNTNTITNEYAVIDVNSSSMKIILNQSNTPETTDDIIDLSHNQVTDFTKGNVQINENEIAKNFTFEANIPDLKIDMSCNSKLVNGKINVGYGEIATDEYTVEIDFGYPDNAGACDNKLFIIWAKKDGTSASKEYIFDF